MSTGQIGNRTGLYSRFKSFFLLTDAGSRNTAMEGLRGYAVLCVVVLHAISHSLLVNQNIFNQQSSTFWGLSKEFNVTDAFLIALANMHYAVDLFFLLSGFLITRIVMKQSDSFSYGSYIKKRFLRIYPPFFVSILFAMVVHVYWFRITPFNAWNLIKNLLMLHGCPIDCHVDSYNFPVWSLFYECSFYLIFPLLLSLWRRARGGVGPEAFLTGITLFGGIVLWNSFMERGSTFFFGIILGLRADGELKQIASSMSTKLVAGLYLTVIAVYALVSQDWRWFSPCYSIAASLLFVKTCYSDGMLNRIFSSMLLRWLGNISFSLYLMHFITLTIIQLSSGLEEYNLSAASSCAIYFVLSFSMSLVLAVLLFATVERWHFRATGKQKARQVQPVDSEGLRVAA